MHWVFVEQGAGLGAEKARALQVNEQAVLFPECDCAL